MHNRDRVTFRRLVPSALLAACLFFLLAAISQADAGRTHGLLWEISKPGISPSYLFGTIHSEDPAVVTLPAPVQQAFDESGTVVLELLMDKDAMMYSATAMLMMDGRLLEDVIGQPLYDSVVPIIATRGISEPVLSRMKPWSVAVTLSVPELETGQVLDLVLYQQALEQGKTVKGLETMQEQLDLFDSMPEADQITLLSDAVKYFPELDTMYQQMLDAYRARDLGALMRINDSYQEKGDKQMADDFQRRVIDERNQRMAERAQPMLKAGKAFIAVGALHLPGETGLLNLLEQQGYRIRRVY
jgi:uncharacterized protein YbaP (TraB family)